MSLLFLPSASFAGSFLSLSLSPTLDRSSRSSSGETTISPLPLFLSLVTQLLRHHGTNIPQSLSRLSRSVHVDTERWRRQVATLLSTHAALRNTDVAPISPLSLSHVRRDHRHRRRRVGLTRPTLNPRLNTKRPLARSSLSRLWGRPAWLFQSLPLVGTGKGRADGAHPISRPAPLAVSQHKM